jgi:imidazole glycerol phosphate synthase subunit HisF
VVFLNITSFRQGVVEDLPMLQVLEAASQNVFVPLTVGGGIREYVDANGKVLNTQVILKQLSELYPSPFPRSGLLWM